MQAANKIGIFDSGLGGLTVFKKLKKRFPKQPFIYLGDLAYLPYGSKSDQAIIDRSKKITDFFIKNNVRAIIVACNSASSVALDTLKSLYNIPIIGVINPSIALATKTTKTKTIGVIGTQKTIISKAYDQSLITSFNKERQQYKLISVACPLFVSLVEEGWENTDIAYDIAHKYCKHFQPYSGLDTLILGCTHYPILIQTLKKVFNDCGYNNLSFIECGEAVADKIKTWIDFNKTKQAFMNQEDLFFITDTSHKFKDLANKFLGYKISNINVISL